MATVNELDLKSPEALCEWLNDGTRPADMRTETCRPWAQTYRIRGESGPKFLKLLPEVQTAALAALPILSELFPKVVPQVKAVDPDRGLLLLAHHGGIDLPSKATFEQEQAILTTYAGVQAEAARHPELISRLPTIDFDALVPNFLEFLSPAFCGTAAIGPVGFRDFIEPDGCKYFSELFNERAGRLAKLIERAKDLPFTINHCDLRPRNTAVRDNGDVVIYDWDEAVAGPAGLSLHNFFSGCSTPCEMLCDPTSAMVPSRSQARQLLGSYVGTLSTHGYSDIASLNHGLPGSICAGVLHYILSYGKFVPPDHDYRDVVGQIIRRRLNDLLELGDFLALRSKEAVSAIIADYETRERPDHACRVLARRLDCDPTDEAALAKLPELLAHEDNAEVRPAILERLVDRHPECGAVQKLYGLWRLEEMDFDGALFHLSQAVTQGQVDEESSVALADAAEFREAQRTAELPGKLPAIRLSADELVRGVMRPNRRKFANKMFAEYGTLLIENAFSGALVDKLRAEYMDRYQRYFVDEKHKDALCVGTKRFMVTVDVDGAFHSPEVYANPHVAPIIEAALGGQMIMGGFVSVASLPGSEDMRVHKDHPALFTELGEARHQSPSFAVTAILPLLGFNLEIGTTRVWKRSHQCSTATAQEEMEHQDPVAPPGSCLLMDYRLTHQGMGNRSQVVRPIVTMIYHRPWFRDIANYGKQDPILISPEALKRVPEEHRHLFSWVHEKTAPAGRD